MPEEKQSGLGAAVEILTLINTLSPAAIGLVKAFISSLQGKTDEELKVAGDAMDDSIIAKADAALAEPRPMAKPDGDPGPH
jgi:hypothetical protein